MEKVIINKPRKYEIDLRLREEGQTMEWLGVVEAMKPGSYEVFLRAFHEKPKTTGHITIKGVAKNGAQVKISGLVRIEKEAVESDSSLTMKVLLVDKKSMATAEPELEILTNKVKASHAATVGRVDEEELFYLGSRGIEKEKAEEMIIKGFLH